MFAWTLVVIYSLGFLYAWILTQVRLHPHIIKTESIYEHPNVVSYHERFPLIAFNMVIILATVLISGHLISFMFTFSLDFSWWIIGLQFIFIALVDDLWFYYIHRYAHENTWLFRHIHSIHHRVRSTLPLDYIYVHPLEWMMGGLGIPLACIIMYCAFGPISAYAFCGFGAFKVFHEINIHSGIKSWILERHPLKFIGSSEHHGNHHFKIKGNYASCFKWLDHLLKSRLN
jgi:sterol desaturase/sphingolipid hydroxylase (fatty acid hydroxylase superfamily)